MGKSPWCGRSSPSASGSHAASLPHVNDGRMLSLNLKFQPQISGLNHALTTPPVPALLLQENFTTQPSNGRNARDQRSTENVWE